MIAVPLWLVPAAPLILFAATLLPGLRPATWAMLPVAALPALLAALADPVPAPVRLDWLLFGAEFALTGIARTFLAFTALLWALSGWQAARLLAADPARDRFLVCFLLAMTGNFGLLVAQDIAAFYTFFAMMSLAAWGLVLHGGGASQRFAGRIYIAFAVAGEIALFAGLAIGAFRAGEARLAAMGSPEVPAVATALMAAGFLVKLGAVPLHHWLPLAHAAAPAPASAVLSGAMLKAGLFGLMTVLPFGGAPWPAAAAALAAMALAGLVLAPVIGAAQGDAKAVLAYSSVGQMSLMALGLAAALAAPGIWPLIAPALVLLAAHHAFAKAALFLGVPAVWAFTGGPRIAVLVVLSLPALALAGLPWTSGWVAKDALKTALGSAATGWTTWLGAALFAVSLGTTLLMVRALWLLAKSVKKPGVPQDVVFPMLGATALSLLGLSIVPVDPHVAKAATTVDLAPYAAALVPVLIGIALTRRGGLQFAPMPPGELIALLHVSPLPRSAPAAPPSPRKPRSLAPRRSARGFFRPDHGSLAILGISAGLALVMAVTSPPASLARPPDITERE